ncbi:MAG TPA: hypothetical protein VNU01_01500, partial [Egibacteraceae bacterium]|nr:hypothetical protein [Egibacteraceae bacterium]
MADFGPFGHPVPLLSGLHPLDSVSSALPPAGVLALWALLAVGAGGWLGARLGQSRPAADVPAHHAAEPLGPWRAAGRVAGVALLALAIVAGRLGNPRELSNIAPALVVGVAWPALLAGSALFGRVWAVLDPWDGIARVLRAPAGEAEPGDVWPAAAVALLWTWYLAVPFDALSPRNVGLALALYSLVTVAGCLVAGRAGWLARAELFGLLSRWLALWRRGATVPASAK